MNRTLREELLAHCQAAEGIRMLDPEEAAAFVERVAERHVLDRHRTWWWEALVPPVERLAYGSSDGLALLESKLGRERTLWLAATDDEPPPWSVVRGTTRQILELLRDCRWFEYWVSDEAASFVVFDTHHQELVIAGVIA